MPIRPTVLVIQNSAGSGLGRFAAWWQQDGLDLEVVPAYENVPIPPLAGRDALVLLGGGLMPDDDADHPWLAAERARCAEALESGLPVLGICLGGQLLAHVAGGEVRARHGQPESGSTMLTRHPDADGDPLFDSVASRFTAMEHRQDAIVTLPPSAQWLASSQRCPIQAFRIGARAWGVQFHPEMAAERVRDWDPDTLAAQGFDQGELIERAEADEVTAGPAWRAFATRFAEQVRAHRTRLGTGQEVSGASASLVSRPREES